LRLSWKLYNPRGSSRGSYKKWPCERVVLYVLEIGQRRYGPREANRRMDIYGGGYKCKAWRRRFNRKRLGSQPFIPAPVLFGVSGIGPCFFFRGGGLAWFSLPVALTLNHPGLNYLRGKSTVISPLLSLALARAQWLFQVPLCLRQSLHDTRPAPDRRTCLCRTACPLRSRDPDRCG